MSSRIRSTFGSIGERLGSSGSGVASARHVFVRDDLGVWQPGLLLEWRHVGSAWWGRVVWVPESLAIEELVRADRLKQAPAVTPAG